MQKTEHPTQEGATGTHWKLVSAGASPSVEGKFGAHDAPH